MTADRLDVAIEAAEAGGSVALEFFRTDLEVARKQHKTDTVTTADHQAQQQSVEIIERSFPEDVIVGEEAGTASTLPAEGGAWVIDPIDGTNNYVRGFQVWSTVVAAVVHGRTVAAVTHLPALDDTVTAGKEASPTRWNGRAATVSERDDPEASHVGILLWWPLDEREEFGAVCGEAVDRFGDIRRIGSSQGALMQVATGGLDGALTTVTGPVWDTVAGVHLIRRAGGTATDVHGEPWTPNAEGLVVSNGRIHDDLLEAAQSAVDPN